MPKWKAKKKGNKKSLDCLRQPSEACANSSTPTTVEGVSLIEFLMNLGILMLTIRLEEVSMR